MGLVHCWKWIQQLTCQISGSCKDHEFHNPIPPKGITNSKTSAHGDGNTVQEHCMRLLPTQAPNWHLPCMIREFIEFENQTGLIPPCMSVHETGNTDSPYIAGCNGTRSGDGQQPTFLSEIPGGCKEHEFNYPCTPKGIRNSLEAATNMNSIIPVPPKGIRNSKTLAHGD